MAQTSADNEETNDSGWNDMSIPSLSETHSSSKETFLSAANSFQLDSTPDGSCSLSSTMGGFHVTCSVGTPEGLRPRLNFRNMRKELGISMEDESAYKHNDDAGNPILALTLPPHDIITEKSWRTTQSHSVESSTQHSSQSLNSLYHHHFSSWSTYDQQSSMQLTAQSPVLHPTRARTAVGAAVAAISDNSGFQPWYGDICQSSSVKFVSLESIDKDFVLEEDRYEQRTPDRSNYALHEMQFTRKTSNFVDADGNSSVVASPSSRARDLNRTPNVPCHGNELNISLNSTANTVKVAHNVRDKKRGACASDIGLAVTRDRFLIGRPSPGISERTQRKRLFDFSYANGDETIQQRGCKQLDEIRLSPNTGTDLSRNKARDRRRYMEELICAAIERLRDNLQLVLEVESLDSLTFEKALKTSISQEGVLTGFSNGKCQVILQRINLLLSEIENGPPVEDIFLSSPAHVDDCTSCCTHHNLIDALIFCKKIARMAVLKTSLNSTNKKWILLSEVQIALGILKCTPLSQELRGSHSQFEDGEESCTPMKSNLSMATTLTSTVGNGRSIFDLGSTVNGLRLRHTIVMLSKVFQRLSRLLMSLSANSFARKSSSIYTVKELTRCYFDLLAINSDNVNELLDSFRYAIEYPLNGHTEPPLSLSLPSSTVVRLGTTNVAIGSGNVIPHRRQRTSRSNNRFAPATFNSVESLVSHRTINVNHVVSRKAHLEDDDLRRRFGSYDKDLGLEEIRDACLPDSFEKNQNIINFQQGSVHATIKLPRPHKLITSIRTE
jgi:hypothetical protein